MMKSRNNISPYKWGAGCLGWKHFDTEGLAVIEEEMPPGTAENWHFHRRAQQVFFVLAGELRFEIEETEKIVRKNESLSIAPGTLHRVLNTEAGNAEFIVISSPATSGDRTDIIEYSPEYGNAFEVLNEEWLEKYFWVEDWDREVLSQPEKHILSKGGKIFYARQNDEIIGTVALMFDSTGLAELTKMAVRADQQGKGTGRQLLKFALKEGKKMGLDKIHLYSNRRLESAIHLYRSLGFEETGLGDLPYQRSDIRMELFLTNKARI